MEPITNSNIHKLVKEYFNDKNNKIPLCDWTTSVVTNMAGLFADINVFDNDDKNDSIEMWDTSNVTDMSNMFIGSNYNQNMEYKHKL